MKPPTAPLPRPERKLKPVFPKVGYQVYKNVPSKVDHRRPSGHQELLRTVDLGHGAASQIYKSTPQLPQQSSSP